MTKNEKTPKKEATDEKTPLVNIDRSKYVAGRTASGTKSLSNGDEVATAIAGIPLDELYTVCDKVCGENDYRTRYAKLNPGMQRMNLGNRLRGQVNKIDKENEKSDKPGASGIDRLLKITAPLQKAAQKVADGVAAQKAKDKKEKEEASAKAKKEKEAKKVHKAKAAA